MDEKPNKSSAWAIVIVLVLAVVPLYVLSIGPAVYLLDHGFATWQDSAEWLYTPVIWVANNCEPLGYLLKRYMAWWVSR